MQRPCEGELAWTALECLLGGDAGNVRVIILLGKVREHYVPGVAVEDFRIGKEFAHHGVGEMPGAAHHALFDGPGIGAYFQHFEVVVGFENQEIRFAQVLLYDFRQIAEVGDDGYLRAVYAEGIADGIGCVMRDGEGIDFDVADLKSLAGLNVLDALHFLEGARWKHLQDSLMGGLCQIRRAIPFASHLREP